MYLKMSRAPGVTLAQLSLWVQSLGVIDEVDAVQYTLERLVEAILANRIVGPEFSAPDARSGLVINHPSSTMLEIIESLDQNEHNRREDQHTAYSFEAFTKLFEEKDLVKLNTDAVFLIMSTWNDPRPFKNTRCIQEFVAMDISRAFIDIGPKLRVCLSKAAFERVKTITMRSNGHGHEIKQEIIPQLIQNANLAKNEAFRDKSKEERTQARSCVIQRMCEWLVTIVFVQLDGIPDANAAPPRPPYSLLRRQVTPLSVTATALIETRNAADSAKADALHVQRWAIAQNRLRFPNQYLDVLGLLLTDLASNSDDCNEQRELFMESADIDLNIINAATIAINDLDRQIAEVASERARLLNRQAATPLANVSVAEQIQQHDRRLVELAENKKKSEDERKILKVVRTRNMRAAIQAIISNPQFLSTLNEHHKQVRMLYRELLMYNRLERVPLRERINDLQFAACIYRILFRLRNTTGDLEQAQACLEEILKLRQARLNEAPQELIWELQTLATVYCDQQKWNQAEYMYSFIIERVLPVLPGLSASIMYSHLGQVLFHKGNYRKAVMVTNEAIRMAWNNGGACVEVANYLTFLSKVYRTICEHLELLTSYTERSFKDALETADEMDERRAAAHVSRRGGRSSSGGSADTRRQLLEEEEDEEDQDDDAEDQDHVRRARSKQVTRQIIRNYASQLRMLQHHIETGSLSYYDESKSRSTVPTDLDEEYEDDEEEDYSEEDDDDEDYDDDEDDYDDDDEYGDEDGEYEEGEEDEEDDTYATTSTSENGRDTRSNPSTYSSQFRRMNDSLEMFPCPDNWRDLCSALRFISFEQRPEFTPYFHVYQKVNLIRDHCAQQGAICDSYLTMVTKKLLERQLIEKRLKELRAQYEASAKQLPQLPIPPTTPQPLRRQMVRMVLDLADLGYHIARLYKQTGNVEMSLEQFRKALDYGLSAVLPPDRTTHDDLATVLDDLDELAKEYIRYRQYANAVALFDAAVKILRMVGPSAIGPQSRALANQAIAYELKGELGNAVKLYEESLYYVKQLPSSNDNEEFKLKMMNKLFFCSASTNQLDCCLKIGREMIAILPPGCRDACNVRQCMSEFLLQANRVDEAMAEYVIVEKDMRSLLDDPRPKDFIPVLRLGISLHLARRDLLRAEKLCREAADIFKHYPHTDRYRFGCDIYVPILLARAQDILDKLPQGTSTNESEDEATMRRMRRERRAALGLVDESISTCKFVLSALEECSTEFNPADERFKATIYCSLGRAYVLKGRLRSAHDYYGKAFSIITRLVNNDLKHPDVVAIHAEMDRIIERAELVGNPEEEDGGSAGAQNSFSSFITRQDSSRSVQGLESHQPAAFVALHPLERSVEERKENSANYQQLVGVGGVNSPSIAPHNGPASSSKMNAPSHPHPRHSNNMNTSDMDSDEYQESAMQRIQQSNMDDEGRKKGFLAAIGDTEDLNLAMESRDQVRDLKSTRNTNSNNNNIHNNNATSNSNKKSNKRKNSDVEVCAGSETSSVQDMAFIPSSSNPNKRKGLFGDWFIGARKSYLSSATSSQHDSAISSTVATLSPRGLVISGNGEGGKHLRNAGESSSNVGAPETISNRLSTINYSRPRSTNHKRKWSLLATCFCIPPEPPAPGND